MDRALRCCGCTGFVKQALAIYDMEKTVTRRPTLSWFLLHASVRPGALALALFARSDGSA